MAENSGIEWTDNTFNPWMGCTKVSPACTNCYAERDFDHRYQKVQWGPNGTRILTTEANWRKPIKWNNEAEREGKRLRVFCASLADVFEDWKGPMKTASGVITTMSDDGQLIRNPECPMGHRPATMDDVRTCLFRLIDATPNLDWLLLTKRPENVRRMWTDLSGCWDGNAPYHRKNVWLGTSVENQEQAEKRIPELLKCRDLSSVLFLSCEPLLGPVDLNLPWIRHANGTVEKTSAIDWVIVGGESGPNARPMHPDWSRSIRDQCDAASVPFHFKQWGEWQNGSSPRGVNHIVLSHGAHGDDPLSLGFAVNREKEWNGLQPTMMSRVGKKIAGRLLDGLTHDGFPLVELGQ